MPQARSNRSVLTVLAWLAAAAVSIAVNGSRSLPNYFVQANPALALTAGAGLLAGTLVPRVGTLRAYRARARRDVARWSR